MDSVKKYKKYILITLFLYIISSIGFTFAWYNYTKTSEGTSKVITGSLYFVMNEGNDTISLNNVFPETKEEARARNDNTITFSVSGKNTSTTKPIVYEIMLDDGTDVNGKERFNSKDLVFDLVEIGSNNEETVILDAVSYEEFNDTRIWVDKVDANTTAEIERTYKLRMWLSDSVIISDSDPNADYAASGDDSFKNRYATIKVAVQGDLQDKALPLTVTAGDNQVDDGKSFVANVIENTENTTNTYKLNITSSNSNIKFIYDEDGESLTNLSTEDINPIVSMLINEEKDIKVLKLANGEPTNNFEKEYQLTGNKKISFNVHLVTRTGKTDSTDLTFTLRKNGEKVQELVKHVTVVGSRYTVSNLDKTVEYTGNPVTPTVELVNPDGTPYDGDYTVTYYTGDSCEGTKLSSPPVNVGTYSRNIHVPESNVAEETDICGKIIITTIGSEVTITNTGGTYTGSGVGVTTIPNEGVVVKYYTNNTCTTLIDSNNETKLPVNAGTYYAKAYKAADQNHEAAETECTEHIISSKTINLASAATLEFNSTTYTGEEIKPNVTITDGNNTLVKGTDYDVEYNDNIDAGTATVTITLKGNYSGSTTKEFTINKAVINVPSSPSDKSYTGSSQNHGVTVPSHTSIVSEGSTLSATAIGNYKVILKLDDTDNYKWNDNTITNKEISWKIVAKTISEDDVTLADSTYTYNGNPIEPSITVKDGNDTLVEGTDYDVDYDDNTDAGEATITITLKGDYEGTIVKHFTINKATITIPSSPSDKTFNGSSQNHGVTVPNGTSIVASGSTTSATNVGNYKIILKIDNTNNYKWSDNSNTNKEISWKIVAKSSSGLETTLSFDDVDYNGNDQEPGVTVKDGNTTLVNGTDYDVEYSDNKNAGEATVTITLKGNYTGTITEHFTINKAKVTVPSSPSDVTYTGTSHNHGVTVPTHTSIVTTGSTLSATSVDNYKVIIKLDDTNNYIWNDNTSVNKEITWKIVKSNTTTSLSNINRDYTGEAQTGSGATSKLSSNNTDITGGTYTYAYYSDNNCNTVITAPANPGTYYIKATLTGTANYNSSSSACKTLTISRRNATLSLGKDSVSVTYKDNEDVTYTYNGDGNITCSSGDSTYVTCNVDTTNHNINVVGQKVTTSPVTITVNAAQGNQYLATSDTFTVTVTKKAVSITAKNQTIDYGSSITTGVNQVTVSGLVSGHTLDSITLTPDTANVTTTGKITPSAAVIKENSTDVTSNYQITYSNGTLTIEKIDATCPTLTAYSGTYDKDSHTITVGNNAVGGTMEYRTATSGDGSSWTSTKPTRTNAGETTVYVRVKGDSNHNNKECDSKKITINTKTLTPTVTASDKQYDGTTTATCASNVSLSGVETGDNVTATASTTGAFASASVGTNKQVTCSSITLAGDDKNNYTVAASATTTADINKKSVTPVISSCNNKTYDGTTSASCTYAAISEKVGSETVSLTGGTCTFASASVGTGKTVTCSNISLTGTNKDNYTLSTTSATKTANITKAGLTVTAENKTMSYGGTAPTYSYTATGYVNNETNSVLTGTATYTIKSGNNTVNNVSIASAGTYSIVPGGLSATNYDITFANGTLTINTVDAVCPSLTAYSGTYDGSSHGITVGSATGGTIKYRTATSGEGSTWTTTAPTRTNVGTTTVYVMVTGDGNHNDKDCASSTITISQREVTVTAPTVNSSTLNYSGSAQNLLATAGSCTAGGTMYYWSSNPSKTQTTAPSFSTSSGWTTTAPTSTSYKGTEAGTYYMWYYCYVSDTTNNKAKSGSSINTALSVTKSIGTVDAVCPSTITAYSGTYDGSSHGITVSGGSGGTIQYRTSTTGTWSNTAPTITNVSDSPKTVYVQVAGDGNHNTKDCGSSTITINKKEVTVTAANKTMNYGGSAPTYSYTVTGAVGSEAAVSGTATYTIKSGNDTVSNVSTASAGSYTIVPSGLTAGGNYSIKYANGTLTINKVDATCPTLTAYSGTYDGSSHGITVSGGSGGTIQYRTSTTGTWSNTAPTITNVSDSPKTVYVQVAGNSNHNTKDCGSSTITINKKEVTVTAANKTMNYGGSAPSYSYTVTGAVGSETAVSGTATYTIKSGNDTVSNVSTASAGSYTIVPSGLTAGGNYSIKYANGTLTINKVDASCPTLTAYSGTYDGSSHGITVSGGSGGTIQYRTSTTGTWSNTAPTITNVSDSPKTVYVQVAGDGNHNTKDCSSSTITINKKPVTVTAENKSMSYGGSAPTYSYTVTGAVGSETAVSGTATYTIKSGNDTVSNVSTASAGSYTIVPGGLTAGGNYSISYANGTLSIIKADCTLSVSNGSMNTGATMTLSDRASGNKGTLSYTIKTNGTTTASSISNGVLTAGAMSADNDTAQSVVVTITDAGNGNYNGCSKDSTITVNKNTRTLSWNSSTPAANATLTYGTSYSAVATASGSGGTAGSITYSSNNTDGATINSSSGAITVVNGNSKSVTITASMARTTTVAATSITRTFTTGKASGYVNLSATSGSVKYGTASTTFTVSGSHGGSLSVSDNNDTATCSINNSTVTCSSLATVAAGTTITVTVKSAATDNYTEGSKTYALSITKADCTLSVSNGSMNTGSTMTLSERASGNKGTLLYTIKTNGTTTASSISNGVLTAGAMSADNDTAQSVVVTITDAGNDNYNGCSKDSTITVNKNTRTLSWNSSTPAANATLTYGTSYSAVATASGSGGTAGSITYSSNNTSGATINSSTGAITVANGNSKSVTITASMARTTTVAATSITRTFTTGKAACTLSVSNGSMNTGATMTLSDRASGNKGTLSYTIKTNGTTTASSISNGVLTAGAMSADNDTAQSVVVTITDAGNDNYNGCSKDSTITVNKITNTLAADNKTVYVSSTTALSNLTKNNNGGSLSATKGTDNTSGSSVSGTNFVAGTLAANDDANKTVALTVTSARTTTVAQGTASVTVTVQKYTREVTVTINPSTVKYGSTASLSITNGGSGGTPGTSVTYSSGTTSVFTVSGSTITAVASSGTSVITASRAGSTTVKAATGTATATATKADCLMTVSNASMTTQDTLDLTTKVSNAVGTVSFAMKTNGTTTASSLSGTNNKTLTAGAMSSANDTAQTVVVTATEAASTNYNSCSKDITITVNKIANTLAANSKTVYVNSVNNYADIITGNNGGALSASVTSDGTTGGSNDTTNKKYTAGVLSTSNDNNGSVVLSVTSARTTTVAQKSVNVTLTVQKYTNNLSWSSGTPAANAALKYGTSYTATATAATNGGTNGSITYSSGTTATMTINSTSGAITVAKADGSTSVITASMARTTTVAATSITRTFSTQKGDCNPPTNVSIASDKKVTWTAATGASSYQVCVATGTNTCTPSTTLSSGSAYNAITDATGTRKVYVRSVCNSTYYNTPSSNASGSTTVYSVTLTAGTGISSVSGGGNYITGATANISATVSTGYVWQNWTGTSTLTSNSNSISINGNKSYTANAAEVWAENLSYDNTNGPSECTGNNANAQCALDAIYDVLYPPTTCPGESCVYTKSSNTIGQAINGTLGTDYKTSYGDYENYFFAHILNNGVIKKSYVCGINANNNDAVFCLRGGVNESSLTDKPIYTDNVGRLNTAFPGCNATTSGADAYCLGYVIGDANSNGIVYVSEGSSYCIVDSDGNSFCS